MTRKERNTIQNNENCQFEIRQGNFIKILGYMIIVIGVFLLIVIEPEYKLPISEISWFSIFLLTLVLLLLLWLFLILPYKMISTKRNVVVDEDQFKIQSNKRKYEIDTSLNELLWWQKVSSIEAGDYIQLKFKSKRVDLSSYEFIDLMKLENLLKARYNHKKKSSR
jgi:amino acid transporter